MPTPQTSRTVMASSSASSPKPASKATIAKAFDSKSTTVKQRVRQWQEKGGGVKEALETLAGNELPPKLQGETHSAASNAPATFQVQVRDPNSDADLQPEGSDDTRSPKLEEQSSLPEGKNESAQQKQKSQKPIVTANRKRQVSATRIRIAQAIIGPTVRPSERLRRLSEAQKDREAQREKEAQKDKDIQKKKDALKEVEKDILKDKKAQSVGIQPPVEIKGRKKDPNVEPECLPVSSPVSSPATPKKRIVSDTRWRRSRDVSQDGGKDPSARDGNHDTIEGWLTSVSPKKYQTTSASSLPAGSMMSQKTLYDEGSKSQNPPVPLQLRAKAVEGEPSSPLSDSSNKRSHSQPSTFSTNTNRSYDGKLRVGNTPKTKGVGVGRSMQESPSAMFNPKPHSAPTSVVRSVPSTHSEHNLLRPYRSIEKQPRSPSESSTSEDSDHLTSISRRPPPKRIPGAKRKILKIFHRQNSKSAIDAALPPKPVRVPTIESWLEHTTDPFLETKELEPDTPFAQEGDIASASGKPDQVKQTSSVTGKEIGAMVPISLGISSRPDFVQDPAADDERRPKRMRRVLRHRDGTVTLDEGTLSDGAKQHASSLRRQGARYRPETHVSTSVRRNNAGRTDTGPSALSRRKDSHASDTSAEGRDDVAGDTRDNSGKIPADKRNSYSQPKRDSLLLRRPAQQTIASKTDSDFQRRLAKHSDLISVLSGPRRSGTSIRSARSIRTHRSRLTSATVDDLLAEFFMDEIKYMRELHTLVDGVIPVLLSSAMSRSKAVMAAGLLQPGATSDDLEIFSKPIFAMGMALEKIRVHHERLSRDRTFEILTWARAAVQIYTEYIKAWRIGFQDVVVNLAPSEGDRNEEPLNRGLPRNGDGDVIDARGERVDVAFLLKRPLVRLKYIDKTLKGLQYVAPSTEKDALSKEFTELVDRARKKSNEERARVEDEKATTIDSTKIRNIQTLEPISKSQVIQERRVKARDMFNLELVHSSGQMMNCRSELYLREDAPESGAGGDLLIAEVDGTGTWLLFPPIDIHNVSARTGDKAREIVVCVRGEDSNGQLWNELFSLIHEDETVGADWVHMLGLEPVPPRLASQTASSATKSQTQKSIQEISVDDDDYQAASAWPVNHTIPSQGDLPTASKSSQSGRAGEWRDTSANWMKSRLTRNNPSTIFEETPSALAADNSLLERNDQRSNLFAELRKPTIESTDDAMGEVSASLANSRYRQSLDSAQHQRLASGKQSAADLGSQEINVRSHQNTHASATNPSAHAPFNSPAPGRGSGSVGHAGVANPSRSKPARYHGRRPIGNSSQTEIALEAITHERSDGFIRGTVAELAKRAISPSDIPDNDESDHASRIIPASKEEDGSTGDALDSPVPTLYPRRLHRRTSSPLKHEYAPSTDSNSASNSEASAMVHDMSSASDSSESEFGKDDNQSILVPMAAIRRYRKAPRITPPDSLAEDTLSPSQSASQAPYRDVPQQPGKSSRTVANVSYWSDRNSWENLCTSMCVVMVSPGLIEVYQSTPSAHQSDHTVDISGSASKERGFRFIMGLELTPLVPIRRGTALDISIRSPPTSDSKTPATTNNNFLFRSQSPDECEILYGLINQARINNPTYIALQNARAVSYSNQFQDLEGKTATRGFKTSWFGIGMRTKGYRASSSAPTPSVSRFTESSVGSFNSAFSAFKNFGKTNGRFNLSRSSVSSRLESRSISLNTSSDGPGVVTSNGDMTERGHLADGALGLNNCKVRLYLRQTTSRWADLGSARLTIMRPSTPLGKDTQGISALTGGGIPLPIEHTAGDTSLGHGIGMAAAGGYTSPGNKISANDKRILVTASPKGLDSLAGQSKILLDVTLGETCFERVARTGIAVSVWENFEGGMVAKQGGVFGGRLRVYMLQFKNEADTAYTYSIVGKLRY